MPDSAFRGGLYDEVLTKDVAGLADITLTNAEARCGYQVYTGVLTGDIDVIFPLAATDPTLRYYVKNSTTGAQTITLKGTIGSGLVVTQAKKIIAVWNGADFEAWTADL